MYDYIKGNVLQTPTQTSNPSNPLNYVKFNYTNNPLDIFIKLHQKYKTTYILESIEGPQKLAQYSFLGFDPKTNITAKNGKVTVTNTKTGQTIKQQTNDPFQVIKEQLLPYRNDMVDFRFVGGALGYISYDAIRYIEKIPTKNMTNCFSRCRNGHFEDGLFLIIQSSSLLLF
jgi:anthranilate synthase component 1